MLKQASEYLSLATIAGGVGIWDFDVVNNKLTWDDQMFRLYGMTPDDFGGAYDTWKAGVHPEDVERCESEVQMALRGEKEFDTEFRVVWPNGTINHIHARARVRRDAAGQPTEMIGTNYDITERKRAEEALRDSEERYRVLFEGSTYGILAADIEAGRFVYANPSICRMLGYSDVELLQLGIADIHPKDSLDHVMSEFESLVRGEKTLVSALPCLRKDGTVFYADIAGANAIIHGRRCTVGFFADVTDRKRAEEALRESEATLRTSLSSTRRRCFCWIPGEWCWRPARWRPRESIRAWRRSSGPMRLPCSPRGRPETFRDFSGGGRDRQPRRFEDVRGDFHLDISMIPIFDQGEVVQVAVLAVDITVRKQADAALRESEQRFRDITENAAEWVWEVDAQGKYRYSSPVVEQLLGYTPEEVLGKYFYDFFIPDLAPGTEAGAGGLRGQTAVPRLSQPQPA